MRVTFLAHDGFLIELNTVCLLFDWWKEPIPPLPDKPLLVFISHRHEDHFNPEVFTLAERKADIQFLLGSDFHLLSRNLEKWRLTPEAAAKCRRCGKHDVFQPLPAVTVETFPSTDEGVAWMVTAEDKAIFHAGDLIVLYRFHKLAVFFQHLTFLQDLMMLFRADIDDLYF